MKIFLYGLSRDEETNIRRVYEEKFTIEDKTFSFTDVLAVPADVIIMDPDSLTKREKDAFSELFRYDHDTVIILNHDVWETEQFPLCGYYLAENLASTDEIERLEEKLTEQARLCEANERLEQVLKRCRMLMMPDPEEKYGTESKIAYINNQCIAYELLCSKLEYLKGMDPKDVVEYRRRLYDMIAGFR